MVSGVLGHYVKITPLSQTNAITSQPIHHTYTTPDKNRYNALGLIQQGL